MANNIMVGGIPTPLKKMKSQIGSSSQLLGKLKNVPNHQPVYVFLSIGTMMTNSFKLGARYSIKLISCQKCPYGVSNCNSFSWLSDPRDCCLCLVVRRDASTEQTHLEYGPPWRFFSKYLTFLHSLHERKKKTLGCCLTFCCHLPYLATPSLCDKNMILSRTKLGWQLSLHQSWDRLIFPHETLSIYGADHLSSRKTRKIVRLSRL